MSKWLPVLKGGGTHHSIALRPFRLSLLLILLLSVIIISSHFAEGLETEGCPKQCSCHFQRTYHSQTGPYDRVEVQCNRYAASWGADLLVAPDLSKLESKGRAVTISMEQMGFPKLSALHWRNQKVTSIRLLNNQNLTSIDPRIFSSLHDSLESITIESHPNLIELPLGSIADLDKLVLLSIQLKTPILEQLTEDFSINNLQNLRSLKLDGEQFANVLGEIHQLRQLTHLTLTNMGISDTELLNMDLPRIPDLQSLNLANNKITRIPSVFINLPSLEVLSVENNQFYLQPSYNLGFNSLPRFLQTLNLRGNPTNSLPCTLFNRARPLRFLKLDPAILCLLCSKDKETVSLLKASCGQSQTWYFPPPTTTTTASTTTTTPPTTTTTQKDHLVRLAEPKDTKNDAAASANNGPTRIVHKERKEEPANLSSAADYQDYYSPNYQVVYEDPTGQTVIPLKPFTPSLPPDYDDNFSHNDKTSSLTTTIHYPPTTMDTRTTDYHDYQEGGDDNNEDLAEYHDLSTQTTAEDDYSFDYTTTTTTTSNAVHRISPDYPDSPKTSSVTSTIGIRHSSTASTKSTAPSTTATDGDSDTGAVEQPSADEYYSRFQPSSIAAYNYNGSPLTTTKVDRLMSTITTTTATDYDTSPLFTTTPTDYDADDADHIQLTTTDYDNLQATTTYYAGYNPTTAAAEPTPYLVDEEYSTTLLPQYGHSVPVVAPLDPNDSMVQKGSAEEDVEKQTTAEEEIKSAVDNDYESGDYDMIPPDYSSSEYELYPPPPQSFQLQPTTGSKLTKTDVQAQNRKWSSNFPTATSDTQPPGNISTFRQWNSSYVSTPYPIHPQNYLKQNSTYLPPFTATTTKLTMVTKNVESIDSLLARSEAEDTEKPISQTLPVTQGPSFVTETPLPYITASYTTKGQQYERVPIGDTTTLSSILSVPSSHSSKSIVVRPVGQRIQEVKPTEQHVFSNAIDSDKNVFRTDNFDYRHWEEEHKQKTSPEQQEEETKKDTKTTTDYDENYYENLVFKTSDNSADNSKDNSNNNKQPSSIQPTIPRTTHFTAGGYQYPTPVGNQFYQPTATTNNQQQEATADYSNPSSQQQQQMIQFGHQNQQMLTFAYQHPTPQPSSTIDTHENHQFLLHHHPTIDHNDYESIQTTAVPAAIPDDYLDTDDIDGIKNDGRIRSQQSLIKDDKSPVKFDPDYYYYEHMDKLSKY